MILILGCSTQNRNAADDIEPGFTPLFDGKSLVGWRNWRSDSTSPGWRIEGGAIARVANGAGDLVTTREYSSFDLRFEWKVAEGSNSGVFFHVSEADDLGLITGPEYQVLDNAHHADGKNPLTSAASNYALHAPPRDLTRPVGQWNEGRIVVDGNHVEHWLNGVKVVEYELGSPDWLARVAKSKFKQWPAYGTRRTGHIALQDHGDPVWYRNLRIRELVAPR